ncbi:MAG: preQ(1) synthase, partial [Verrucomicrobiota bacterium]
KPEREYWIRLTFNEFSSLCPVTGQPDGAKLTIAYLPGEKCVETKSLKFYLNAFRNFEGFNEAIINRIADDLVAVCDPVKLEVRGEFVPRGGIQLTVEVTHPSAE